MYKRQSENSGNKIAESRLDSTESQNLKSGLQETSHSLVLPRAINCARNDNSFRDSAHLAQNDKVKNSQNLPKFARYSKSKFYKLLPSKDGKKELILAKLFTGRTHQIRAHLESINRHIVGDELYGYKRGKGDDERVMLHAYLLELTHPKESSAGNSVLGMQFRTCGNFRTSTDSSLVESPKISTNTKATPQSLPLRFCESQNLGENLPIHCHSERSEESQKKNNRDSSPTAQNDNFKRFAESSLVSANPKLRFIAPLFDDMKDYLAKNFDMEKVYEILHGLPARAF